MSQSLFVYDDPDLYDAMAGFSGPAEKFYVAEALAGNGPVLELGCGTGRYLVPIARESLSITGLDSSLAMLRRAEQKAEAANVQVDLVEGDLRDFSFDREFDTILVPSNTLLHLSQPSELLQCLGSVRDHLSDSGRFVFDIFHPDLDRLQRHPDFRFPVRTIESAEGEDIRIEETSRYDPVSQVRMATWYFIWPGGEERAVELNVRVIFPQELLVLLEAAGIRLINRFGDFERTPLGPDSRSQVCICAKA